VYRAMYVVCMILQHVRSAGLHFHICYRA